MYRGFTEKKWKPKEEIRPGAWLIHHLPQGTRCGEVTRDRKGGLGPLLQVNLGKVMRRCMIDKGSSAMFGTGKGEHLYKIQFHFTFTKENVFPAFLQKGGRQSCSYVGCFSLPSVQNNLYARMACFGVACSDTCQSILTSSYSINRLVIDNLS